MVLVLLSGGNQAALMITNGSFRNETIDFILLRGSEVAGPVREHAPLMVRAVAHLHKRLARFGLVARREHALASVVALDPVDAWHFGERNEETRRD